MALVSACDGSAVDGSVHHGLGQPRRGAVLLARGAGEARQPLCADIEGFSLHAAVRVEANDRMRLQQRCRCITRPALSGQRVQQNTTREGIRS